MPHPPRPRSAPWRRVVPALLAVLLALPLAALSLAAPADATGQRTAAGRPWPGHPDRRIVTYRVRPGDTAAGIATRFHAWTAELRGLNGKAPGSSWYVGERVRVPVVVSRSRTADRSDVSTPRATRTEVRRAVVRTARRHDVPVRLALAVAWHESGWQQQVRSPVGAIGVMQVMPGNRAWLSMMTGRLLRLKDLEDNVTAGVVLLKLLRLSGHSDRTVLSGYYQGQGSVEANGLYESTKHYIANVRAVRHRLDQGWRPDRS